MDEATQEWLNEASEIVNEHLRQQMRATLFGPLIERAYQILLKRGLVMDIEDATPARLTMLLESIVMELNNNDLDALTRSIPEFKMLLDYYFEMQRQKEI